MKFVPTTLQGACVIEVEPREDERGFFARAWCQREMAEQGLDPRVVQCNLSFNHTRGTVRGMHYQVVPYQESKLVRCVRGSIFDVVIDLRPESATYAKWFGVELSAENRNMLFVPEGFAHGYQTLLDDTEVFYQVSEFYQPGSEAGIRWDDPAFAIKWPIEATLISDKDRAHQDFPL
jgi:dTDP-4-dehydrorhamnose 3,5-epimerase